MFNKGLRWAITGEFKAFITHTESFLSVSVCFKDSLFFRGSPQNGLLQISNSRWQEKTKLKKTTSLPHWSTNPFNIYVYQYLVFSFVGVYNSHIIASLSNRTHVTKHHHRYFWWLSGLLTYSPFSSALKRTNKQTSQPTSGCLMKGWGEGWRDGGEGWRERTRELDWAQEIWWKEPIRMWSANEELGGAAGLLLLPLPLQMCATCSVSESGGYMMKGAALTMQNFVCWRPFKMKTRYAEALLWFRGFSGARILNAPGARLENENGN